MELNKTHVFYTDAANGWAVTALTADDYQIGEAEYCYRKSDAISTAKRHGVSVHVFGRNGLHQRIITA